MFCRSCPNSSPKTFLLEVALELSFLLQPSLLLLGHLTCVLGSSILATAATTPFQLENFCSLWLSNVGLHRYRCCVDCSLFYFRVLWIHLIIFLFLKQQISIPQEEWTFEPRRWHKFTGIQSSWCMICRIVFALNIVPLFVAGVFLD